MEEMAPLPVKYGREPLLTATICDAPEQVPMTKVVRVDNVSVYTPLNWKKRKGGIWSANTSFGLAWVVPMASGEYYSTAKGNIATRPDLRSIKKYIKEEHLAHMKEWMAKTGVISVVDVPADKLDKLLKLLSSGKALPPGRKQLKTTEMLP